jgi:galactokinase
LHLANSASSLVAVKHQLLDAFGRAFGNCPHRLARAPGRVEFIGNHTDYNGGPVLGATIDRSVWVAVSARNDGRIRLSSPARVPSVEADASNVERQSGQLTWANYPLGVYLALRRRGLVDASGFDFIACSSLPSGSGLSSSAALELATAIALTSLSGARPSRKELAVLCREAENEFVGVPCGILDQGVSSFGRAGHLVHIDCATLEFSNAPLPAGTRFCIFNTHTKHALVDSFYGTRHRECMTARDALRARDPALDHLAHASTDALARLEASLAPEIVRRARHVIEESGRVRACVAALQAGDVAAVGRLLTASHRSSQHLFENSSPELDTLVDLLEPHPRVLGARLSGGGFGGAVLALVRDTFTAEDARGIARAYAGRHGSEPDILEAETSEGAEPVPL